MFPEHHTVEATYTISPFDAKPWANRRNSGDIFELLQSAKNGDEGAFEDLIAMHIGMANVAMNNILSNDEKYAGLAYETDDDQYCRVTFQERLESEGLYEDFEQECLTELISALRELIKMDTPEGPDELSRYTYVFIRSKITDKLRRFLGKPGMVSPETIDKVENELAENTRSTRPSRLIEAVKSKAYISSGLTPLDIDDPDVYETQSGLIEEGFEDRVALAIGRQAIMENLDFISERKATIIKLHYGLEDDTPRTLQSVGKQIGLSRGRVRQIESVAFCDLRSYKNKKLAKLRDLI